MRSAAGRELYAIGSNPEAAELAGIRRHLRVFTRVRHQRGAGRPRRRAVRSPSRHGRSTAGTGYELIVITAVVVGGVAIFGGSGSVIGAALGAILLQTINQALVAVRISSFWDQAIAGALLLAAISFDKLIGRPRDTGAWRPRKGPLCRLRRQPSARRRAGRRHRSAGVSCDRCGAGKSRSSLCSSASCSSASPSPRQFSTTHDDPLRGARHRPGRDHGAADDDDRHHRGDRPVRRVDARTRARRCSAMRSHTTTGVVAAMAIALAVGALGGALNGFLVDPPRAALDRGDDRHADDVPRHRGGDPRAERGDRLPDLADHIGVAPIFRHIAYPFGLFLVLAVIYGVVVHKTPFGRSLLRDRPEHRGGVLLRHPRQADQVHALRALGRGLRAVGILYSLQYYARRSTTPAPVSS